MHAHGVAEGPLGLAVVVERGQRHPQQVAQTRKGRLVHRRGGAEVHARLCVYDIHEKAGEEMEGRG